MYSFRQYKSPSNDKMNNSGVTKKVKTSSNLPKDLSLFDDLDVAGCSKTLSNKCETPSNDRRALIRCEDDIMVRSIFKISIYFASPYQQIFL